MPTPAEHRALLFVAAVAALGVGARGISSLTPEAPAPADRAALARQIASVDSAITAGGRRPTSSNASTPRPPRTPTTLRAANAAPTPPTPQARPSPPSPPPATDLDRADAVQLELLPGIGPALAARIVADRDMHGPFGSLEALQRVKGIGPALAKRLQPYVTFSLPPRPTDAEHSARSGGRRP